MTRNGAFASSLGIQSVWKRMAVHNIDGCRPCILDRGFSQHCFVSLFMKIKNSSQKKNTNIMLNLDGDLVCPS